LVQAFEDSERFHVVAYTNSQEELEEYLREERAQAGIVIPTDFSRNIKRGLASRVLVQVNGSNLMFANPVISSAQEIIQTFSAGAGQKLLEAEGQIPDAALSRVAPVRFGLRILNNPTYGYGNFMMAGLGANGLQLGIILAICTALTSIYGKLGEWQGTGSRQIVLGKLLPYLLWGIVTFAAYMMIAVQFLLLPFKGDLASLLLIGSAFVFAVTAAGLLVSAIAPNEIDAVQLPIVYIMPAFLFCGYIWPEFAMNSFSKAVSAVLPLTYAAVNMRDIMLNGYAPTLYRDAAILAAFGIILVLTTIGIFSYRRDHLRTSDQQTGTGRTV